MAIEPALNQPLSTASCATMVPGGDEEIDAQSRICIGKRIQTHPLSRHLNPGDEREKHARRSAGDRCLPSRAQRRDVLQQSARARCALPLILQL